jgi:hypothetical protein
MAATKTTTKPSANGTAAKTETPAKNERLAVLKTYKIYINGQFPRTESGRYYTIKLSNKEQVNVCLSSRKDFRNSVSAAREAQGIGRNGIQSLVVGLSYPYCADHGGPFAQ